MRAHLRAQALVASALLAAALGFTPSGLLASASAIEPRTTLPAIESQVMCATCKIPLQVAQSPQADRERAFIEALIAQGRTEAQIKRALVFQYGRSVLATPSSIFAYLVPILVVLALLAALGLLVLRWRRHGRVLDEEAPAPAIGSTDAMRLEEDMAQHPS